MIISIQQLIKELDFYFDLYRKDKENPFLETKIKVLIRELRKSNPQGYVERRFTNANPKGLQENETS